MTPKQLKSLCNAIWGRDSAYELSRSLAVCGETARRWLRGTHTMPANKERLLVNHIASYKSMERHLRVKALLRQIKNPRPYKALKEDVKIMPTVMIQPWKKLPKGSVIVEEIDNA